MWNSVQTSRHVTQLIIQIIKFNHTNKIVIINNYKVAFGKRFTHPLSFLLLKNVRGEKPYIVAILYTEYIYMSY